MKFKKLIAVSLASVVAASVCGCSGGLGMATASIYDCKFEIDGQTIQFPLKMSELKEMGWSGYQDYSDCTLGVNTKSWVYLANNDGTCLEFDVYNTTDSEAAFSEWTVYGCRLTGGGSSYESNVTGDAVFPKGIVFGEATMEEVESAYGEPNSSSDTSLNYQKSSDRYVTFYFDDETGQMTSVDMESWPRDE